MILEYSCHAESVSNDCASDSESAYPLHAHRMAVTSDSRTLFPQCALPHSESESRHRPTRNPCPPNYWHQSLWLVVAICSALLCVTMAQQQAEGNTNEWSRFSLMRQLRHRLHVQQSDQQQQHKRHQYYHHAHKNASLGESPGSVASIYLLQQLVRQQQSSSRHRHPYYYFYSHDNSSELNPMHSHTHRKWSSRQSNVRLLRDRAPKVIYQLNGIQSDDQLPVCEPWQVCNKVDTYATPWIEKQCRCASEMSPCSQSLTSDDGHTVVEKTRQYKTCEAIGKLPKCRYFRDITWTVTTTSAKSEQALKSFMSSTSTHHYNAHHHRESENITRQEMKCQCPPNSVAYIFKHQVYKAPDGQLGYRYHFACSPETKLRCKRKEPCRLFTARKRPKVEEVSTNTLCQCPGSHSCPANHRHPSVLIGTVYPLDNIHTYSGYCYPDNSAQGSDYLNIDSADNEQNLDGLPRGESGATRQSDEKVNKQRSMASSERTKHNSKHDMQEEKYLLSLLR